MLKRFAPLLGMVLMLGLLGLVGCAQDPPPPPPPPAAQPPVEPAVETQVAEQQPETQETVADDAIVWRVSESHSIGYPTEVGLSYFAERLAELTGGEIIVEVHAGGTIAPEVEAIQMVRDGELEMVRVAVNMLQEINPYVDAFAMPFLYRDREHMFSVLDGPLGQDFLETFRDGGLRGLTWFDAGARSFYFSDVQVSSIEDMQGLTIRVPPAPLMTGMVELLGANTIVVPFGEVNAAFQGGQIDGAENSILSYEATGRPLHAPYLLLTEHIRTPELILINADLFESLTPGHQAAVLEAARDAGLVQRADWLRQETAAEDNAVLDGAIITRLTEEQRQPFVDAMAPLYDENQHLADIIRQIREDY